MRSTRFCDSAWSSSVNKALGRDFLLKDLREQGFRAVFLAIGAHRSKDLRIEGMDLDGVLRGVEFLLNVNWDTAFGWATR